ncbi:hypothetical protein AXG93_1881s1080 [Marchantia polymorpha subsp. ruderalis]|uniref:Uncharacterized protein n=1 Tax=Marchantia polymorpha subsp. ruderalis TaxID=1480154 RepID=A0A176W457_MARPO|nr:hypothetical protein AXG93_1881s1080 [Marchantia polymorpha subsp. ruderalis]
MQRITAAQEANLEPLPAEISRTERKPQSRQTESSEESTTRNNLRASLERTWLAQRRARRSSRVLEITEPAQKAIVPRGWMRIGLEAASVRVQNPLRHDVISSGKECAKVLRVFYRAIKIFEGFWLSLRRYNVSGLLLLDSCVRLVAKANWASACDNVPIERRNDLAWSKQAGRQASGSVAAAADHADDDHDFAHVLYLEPFTFPETTELDIPRNHFSNDVTIDLSCLRLGRSRFWNAAVCFRAAVLQSCLVHQPAFLDLRGNRNLETGTASEKLLRARLDVLSRVEFPQCHGVRSSTRITSWT